MATKKSSKSTKFKRFSKFNPVQFFGLVAVFSVIGAVSLYYSHAATNPWVALANSKLIKNHSGGEPLHCPLNGFGVPPTIVQHHNNTADCVIMLKYIILRGHGVPVAVKNSIGNKIDPTFGDGTTRAVKMIKKHFGDYNKFLAIDGYVDLQGWVIMMHIYLHGWDLAGYAPPQPPDTGNGYLQRPPFSGVLNKPDHDNFGSLYDKYNSAGWCIVHHESLDAGMYAAIQNNGAGPATGAFQFEGGYGTIPNSHTWDKGVMPHFSYWPRGYHYAALAPPDVQWTAFFWLYQLNPGAWHGTNCPGT